MTNEDMSRFLRENEGKKIKCKHWSVAYFIPKRSFSSTKRHGTDALNFIIDCDYYDGLHLLKNTWVTLVDITESDLEIIEEPTTTFANGSSNQTIEGSICTHPNKYKNVVSANIKFWFCPDCKQDLGDI